MYNDYVIKSIKEKDGDYFLNKENNEAYLKVTHLMDPIKVAQGQNDEQRIGAFCCKEPQILNGKFL